MKRIEYLLIIFFLVTIISCDMKGNNNSEHIKTSKKTKLIISSEKKTDKVKLEINEITTSNKTQNKLSLKSEQSTCIIKKIKRIDNRNLITVDFIVLKCGKTDDGLDNCDVINNNPKLRTYILSDELFNKNKEALEECDICFWNIEASKGEIISINHFVLS